MKRPLDTEDQEPLFFFSELCRIEMTSSSDRLVCDKGWFADHTYGTITVFDSDLNRMWSDDIATPEMDDEYDWYEPEIDFVIELGLFLIYDDHRCLVYHRTSAMGSFEPVRLIEYQHKRFYTKYGKVAGTCLSICGKYVFTTGGPRGDVDPTRKLPDQTIAIYAWSVASGKIVAEAQVEAYGYFICWWTLCIPDKHLRFASDGRPTILCVHGWSPKNSNVLQHFFFDNDEFRSLNYEEYYEERFPGQVQHVEPVPNLGAFFKTDERTGNLTCDPNFWKEGIPVGLSLTAESQTDGARLPKDANHDEAIFLIEPNVFARISIAKPTVIHETGKFDNLIHHFWCRELRGALGRLLVEALDESSEYHLALFSTGGLLDKEYYRLAWRPELHLVFPQEVRRRVFTFALCLRRLEVFPRDIRRLILRFLIIDF